MPRTLCRATVRGAGAGACRLLVMLAGCVARGAAVNLVAAAAAPFLAGCTDPARPMAPRAGSWNGPAAHRVQSPVPHRPRGALVVAGRRPAQRSEADTAE
jgi:hypothetical protein